MLLRLSVNTYVSCCVLCIFWMAMSIAFSSALKIFGYPGDLSKFGYFCMGYIPLSLQYCHYLAFGVLRGWDE